MQSRYNHLLVIGLTVVSTFLLSLTAKAQQQTQSQALQSSDMKAPSTENTKLVSIFPEFDSALDSALAGMTPVLKEVSPSIRTLLLYKTKIRWPFKEELTYSEIQFLSSYFEGKLKNALTKERRFAAVGAQDLKTLSFKATDSTLQVKNTYTEDEIRAYAKAHNVDGIVFTDVLVSANQIIMFVNINDINGITVWSKELKADYRVLPTDPGSELAAAYALKRKTGLIENYITVGFDLGTPYALGIKDPKGAIGFYAVGYRLNEMATIFHFLKFYIDSRVLGTSEFGLMGAIIMPGFSFEIIGNDQIGPGILMLDLAGGFDISFRNSALAQSYYGGLSLRLSRNIGITGFYNVIAIDKTFKNFDVAGPLYGMQVNFVL
jgi:hypothetical protein